MLIHFSFFAIFGNAFGFQNEKNAKNTDNRRGDEELRNGMLRDFLLCGRTLRLFSLVSRENLAHWHLFAMSRDVVLKSREREREFGNGLDETNRIIAICVLKLLMREMEREGLIIAICFLM